ncbi:phosphate signaling complex protein PhoU [Alkalihalobacillus pseudalcaliphilus]|uniref:phosphate signaling complex protein PhoU n=1 Tax=Alkalihalobacillus pseudalcaliphilus TaxID=79884 RepID=UPI00064D86FB|nr:phosphate signaling complex protein PhoU [Alkalihalobacillus pseudalcaliphilus]KMK77379.1 hypothetical protein AB990_02555 [Alkalihalobacillus pseudalcaliphilus]
MQNNLRTFTKAIDDIERKIIEMADITGQELQLAVHSLTDREKNNHCQQVLQLDRQVDDYDYQIYSSIIELILIQPPLPVELKTLTIMNRISREYERIGDQAVNIADLAAVTKLSGGSRLYQELKEMCDLTTSMLASSIYGIQEKDPSIAEKMEKQEDEVDQYFHRLHQYIVDEMRHEPEQIGSLANLLLVSRYLERSADHVVNVTRQVTQMVHMLA